jgi:hypothetical protein
MRCVITGKSFAGWAKFYGTSAKDPSANSTTQAGDPAANSATQAGGKKKGSNTKYFATLEVFADRKVEDIDKYEDHVTHCTPCNLDPENNYVSDDFYNFSRLHFLPCCH